MARSAAGPADHPDPRSAAVDEPVGASETRLEPLPAPPIWEPIVDAIGPKVRDLRQQSGLSLQQLARRADVSAAAIHKVERGDMVPTITTLLKLAAALERPVGHFVDDGTHAPVASFVAARQRPDLPSPHASVTRAGITGAPERFRIAGALTVLEPGASGGDEAPHSGEELVHVLVGALDFEVAGERHTVADGDTLQYPADRSAQWSNPGEIPTRAVWLSTRGS